MNKTLPTISELVKNKTATFKCYRDSELWYEIDDFTFPIPISDAGTGIFDNEMKAIHLMRWIRKHLETIKSW